MNFPRPLRLGDKIAIVSPASAVAPELISGAEATLRSLGYRVEVGAHARGESGSFSAPVADRLADMRRAIEDPDTAAILCSRGGYGCVHLLEGLDPVVADNPPKWLVGFSDVSALHALWGRHSIPSVHASMCRQMAQGADDPRNRELLAILQGRLPRLSLAGEIPPLLPEGSPREARGKVVGGNLAVFSALMGTPYFPASPGDIMVIEDIAEPIYKTERILMQMRLAGLLDGLSALVVGRFTDYRPSRDHSSVEEMVRCLRPACPVVFSAPFGHIGPENRPFLLNAPASLRLSPSPMLDYVI